MCSRRSVRQIRFNTCVYTRSFSEISSSSAVQASQHVTDMPPPSDFLIVVPHAREVPDMNRAVSKFFDARQRLWALSMQVQLGQSAVFDTSGILYTILQRWQNAHNDGFMVQHKAQDNALLQIRRSPCSASKPVAALTLQHGVTSTWIIGQSQGSSLLNYLQKMRRRLLL